MKFVLNRTPVRLTGTPAEVGTIYGRATAAPLRQYVTAFLGAVQAGDVPPDEIRARVAHYQRIVDRIAPAWTDEAVAIAQAAGVDPDNYIAYVAQKYVLKGTRSLPPPPPHECTSFLSVGAASAGNRSILHKNRDSYPRAQALWRRAVSGTYNYLGGGDSSDHGVIHFLNEQGLAGVMNAGSPNDDTVPRGLPTPQVLRLIAERAATCQEALELLREIVGNGWYTNGTSGSIWLFVDRARGLIVENTFHHIDHQWIDDAVAARANDFFLPATAPYSRPDGRQNPRYVVAQTGVDALAGRVTAAGFNALSRHCDSVPQKVCGDNTLSGFTAVIGGEPADLLSYAWVAVGQPNNTVYIPLFSGVESLPHFVVDGTLWTLAERLHSKNPTGPYTGLPIATFEDQVERELNDVLGQATDLIRSDRRDETVRLLTNRVADWSHRAALALEAADTPAGVV